MGSRHSITTPLPNYETTIKDLNLNVVKRYTAQDYGPLSYHEKSNYHANNFRGASYCMVNSKHGGTIVHRLYDGKKAKEMGQYFLCENRAGNLATRLDMAIHPDWNKLTMNKEVWIPPGFAFFIGVAAPQQTKKYSLLGGGCQIFIPNSTLKHIYAAQTDDPLKRQQGILQGLQEQVVFFENYSKDLNEVSKSYIKDYMSQANVTRLAKYGNNLANLPMAFRRALNESGSKSGVTFANPNDYPKGTYVIHRERLKLPNGNYVNLQLSSRLRYDGSSTRTYMSGKTKVIETTHKFTIIYTWS
jgi:hypothetical protein